MFVLPPGQGQLYDPWIRFESHSTHKSKQRGPSVLRCCSSGIQLSMRGTHVVIREVGLVVEPSELVIGLPLSKLIIYLSFYDVLRNCWLQKVQGKFGYQLRGSLPTAVVLAPTRKDMFENLKCNTTSKEEVNYWGRSIPS